MRPLINLGLSLCLCLVLAASLSADELHLKDGTVIKGLIVSYDQNTFRVKTSFGYAVIRRDAVVSIVMTGVNSAPALKPGGVVGPIPVTAAPGSPAEAAAKKEAEEASKNAPATPTPAAAPATSPSAGSTPAATEANATPPPASKSSNAPATTTATPTPTAAAVTPSAGLATPNTATNSAQPASNQPSAKPTSVPAPSVSNPPPSTSAATESNNPPPTPTPAPARPTATANEPATMPAPSPRASTPAPNATLSASNNSPRQPNQPSSSNSASAQTPKPAPSSPTSVPANSASVSSNSRASTASNLPPPLIGEGANSTQPSTSNQTSASNQGRPTITTSASNQATPISVTPAYNGASNQPYKPSESQTLASQLAPLNPAETHSAVSDYTGADYTAHSRNPAAQPIREYIVANTYFNQTFDFKMYRPPEWGLIDSAHAVLPGAIAALGTDDEKTYLLIGASPATGSLDVDLHTADTKLKEILDHYRSLNDAAVAISGFPALEHHFRGGIDQREWAGALVVFERGSELYTVLGMTEADTDLSLLKENIIQRVITSVDFSH